MHARLAVVITAFLAFFLACQPNSRGDNLTECARLPEPGHGESVCPWRFYGEFLYMQPRNGEVVYATPMNGPIVSGAVPIQVGRLGIIDPDYEPGFKVGFGRRLTCESRLGAAFTHYENKAIDQIAATIPSTAVIRSMVLHPSSPHATTDFSAASARQDIDFDLADLEYRHVFASGCQYEMNYLVGARFARLEQSFFSEFVNGGTETVATNICFDGGGIRLGLEGERRAHDCGLMVYGRSMVSCLAGEFRGEYLQGSTSDPTVVDTYWKAGRVVTILDIELGVGWVSSSGCFRVTGGYVFSSWLNVVKTNDLIGAVQTNNFDGLAGGSSFGTGLTFDGLTARAEFRW